MTCRESERKCSRESGVSCLPPPAPPAPAPPPQTQTSSHPAPALTLSLARSLAHTETDRHAHTYTYTHAHTLHSLSAARSHPSRPAARRPSRAHFASADSGTRAGPGGGDRRGIWPPAPRSRAGRLDVRGSPMSRDRSILPCQPLAARRLREPLAGLGQRIAAFRDSSCDHPPSHPPRTDFQAAL